jgi:hypothetical protein
MKITYCKHFIASFASSVRDKADSRPRFTDDHVTPQTRRLCRFAGESSCHRNDVDPENSSKEDLQE